MRELTLCPDGAALAGLLEGTLAEADEARLAGHLDRCDRCRAALDSLAGATGITGWRPPAPPDEHLRTAIESLKTQPVPLAEWADREDLLVGLLAPTDEPGLLGRLGPYEVTGVVGRGGAGVVFKGFDPSLNRFVAIKVLTPHLASSAAARRRFAREARATAAVTHENVVAVHGVDEANGLPYLVMEYVAGISLQERIDRAGPLELEEALRIGAQTAAGLAAAHAQGLVHRDVKPGNLLLESGMERVKITDFGLARAADDASLTQSGVVAGTPGYMAPEQARGEPVDPRADLFSLGSVLYAICTGRAPFRANGTLAVLRRVCEDEPLPVRDLNPSVPEWLAAIITRLHAKDPADRFESAAEVARLLSRCLAHSRQPALVPPPRVTGLRRRALRRRLAAVAALVGAAALAVLAASFLAKQGWLPIREAVPQGAGARPTVRPRGALTGLRKPVYQVAFSPGSEVLATAGGAGEVRLWDLTTNQPRGTLPGGVGSLWSVAFAPNGTLLAAAGGDWAHHDDTGGIVVWDATTQARLFDLHGHPGLVFSVAFSPDSRTLASGGWDGTVRLWDATSGQELALLRGHKGRVRSVCFSPDGSALARADLDGTVLIYEVGSRKLRRRIDTGAGWVNCVAFSPDGSTLATAENQGALEMDGKPIAGGPVGLWDAVTGARRATLKGPRGAVLAVAFSPDGKSLVSGGGQWKEYGDVALWDVASGQERLALHGNAEWVECVAFSPDGRTLVSGGGDPDSRGEVKLWDLAPAAR
jgi:WD40 repeat protein